MAAVRYSTTSFASCSRLLRRRAKPEEYSWRQLVGAGALAGIGFTMSLFIASQALPDPADFTAVKIAVFAGSQGVAKLAWRAERSRHCACVRPDAQSATRIGAQSQLEEVFLNLIHNAIEAMSTTVDRRALQVRTKVDGGEAIVVEIEDSGPANK
jgi:signal transduction histidine kinase